jgi:hypothetical protein
MKVAFAILALSLGLGTFASAEPAQLLSVSFRASGAQATQLPSYDPAQPIVVRVADTKTQHLDELAVLASGPSGESLRVALTPSGSGTFSGSLMLDDPGTWSVHLAARSGNLRTTTAPVAVTVEAPPPSDAWLVGLGVGATIFVVIGGAGFVLLRRLATPRAANRQPA